MWIRIRIPTKKFNNLLTARKTSLLKKEGPNRLGMRIGPGGVTLHEKKMKKMLYWLKMSSLASNTPRSSKTKIKTVGSRFIGIAPAFDFFIPKQHYM